MATAIMTRDRISQAAGVAIEDDDFESPAGPSDASTMCTDRREYIYRGEAETHWIDQPCGREKPDRLGTGRHDWLVVFACGCRAWVPASTLEPRHTE